MVFLCSCVQLLAQRLAEATGAAADTERHNAEAAPFRLQRKDWPSAEEAGEAAPAVFTALNPCRVQAVKDPALCQQKVSVVAVRDVPLASPEVTPVCALLWRQLLAHLQSFFSRRGFLWPLFNTAT